MSSEIDPIFGCHLWTGAISSTNKRPTVFRGGSIASPHKLAYEAEHGIVPIGLVLDHLCRRVRCVNVEHLEAVTKAENERRKSWAYRCKRKLCSKGHDLSTALVTPEMGRLCRTCQRGNGR